MDEQESAVDIATVDLSPEFPELAAFPSEFGIIATLLSPEGVQVELHLPGGETRTGQTSGRDLLCSYAFLGSGQRAPWCLGEGIAEPTGNRIRAPGSPPLEGTPTAFRRTLGTVVAALFRALASETDDPVATAQRCLGPGIDIDIQTVYDEVGSPR